MRVFLVLLLAVAAPALAHDESRTYRLPGDPDTMVRRGPEVVPAPTPARELPADPGTTAVRAEDVPVAPQRPPRATQLTVTREVFLPWPYVVHPRTDWRLRLGYHDGQWDGSLVIGHPGLLHGHPLPQPGPGRGGLSPWSP